MAGRQRLVPFAITALVLVTVTVPLAYVTAPYVERRAWLSRLDHPDAAVRRRAMAYAAARLTDPVHGVAVRDAVFGRMADDLGRRDRESFEPMRDWLDRLGMWRQGAVPQGLWEGWVMSLAESDDASARAQAAWMIADARPGMAGAEWALLPLMGLSDDPDLTVRINALAAGAEISGEPGAAEAYRFAIQDLWAGEEQDTLVRAEADRLLTAIDRVSSGETRPPKRALAEASPGELLAGLSSNDAGLQALALTCLRAGVTPIDEAEQADLAGALLRSFDPVERRAGALLAGATGTHGGLLAERLASAGDYSEASMLRLGLWLRGRGEPGWDPALLLATPEALPMPLVRWGMVVPTLLLEPGERPAERRRVAAAALDDWLVPRGDLPQGLVDELFDDHGWQAMAPLTAWVGAAPGDADVRELAAERLRDHWLVTRRRFLGDPGTAEASR